LSRVHHQRCSNEHYGQSATIGAVFNIIDPNNIPFNALIVGPTSSGKTKYVVGRLRGPFRGEVDYIVLIYPTFVYNKTYDGFVDKDPYIFVVNCQQEEVENWLKLVSFFFEKTNTLIIFGRPCCIKRRERTHKPAGIS